METLKDAGVQKATRLSSRCIEPHLEALEQWYQSLGKPKAITQKQKDEFLRKMRDDNIECDGMSLRKLNYWLLRRRREDKESPLSIIFPTLTKPELTYLKRLVKETPHPSLRLIEMWIDSPLLPNVTIDIAQQFVKYQLLLRDQHRSDSTSPSTSKRSLTHDDSEMCNTSEEEDMLPDERGSPIRTHLPTPTSTSPEPLRLFKPEPLDDNTITSNDTFPTFSTPTTHSGLPRRDPSAGTSSLVSIPKQSPPHDIVEELTDSFHEEREAMSPARFSQLLETCQEKSEKFLVALKRGQLKNFGLLPFGNLDADIKMAAPSFQTEHATAHPEPP